jgi:hypothetical protein
MAQIAAQTEPARREADVEGKGKDRTEKIRIEQHSAAGMLWFIGWLFTVGYLHLPFGKALLGLVIWPYYLGSAFTSLP